MPILFVSYLRIGRIDFDATLSHLVASSWICRIIQSTSFLLRGSWEKLRIKENEIGWQNRLKYGWHLGTCQKVEVSLFPSKVDYRPLKKFIGASQKMDPSPSKGDPLPSILMSCWLNSWSLPLNVKHAHRRHSNVDWPITINQWSNLMAFWMSYDRNVRK
jgi:hypothetical protein